ncbi:hypothetical protein [Acinetobacter modestus]|uniref:hypothetical protein n=1 Tax=Acinetobacter modestus TaxID=1776740 RepID=UPI003208B90E
MRSEFNDWYEKWTGSKVKCENTDIIGAWNHQQSKVDELQKRVDASNKVLGSIRKELEHGHLSDDESKTLFSYANDLEQALKGGEE